MTYSTRKLTAVCGLSLVLATRAFADLTGTQHIYLLDKNQTPHTIGKITFTQTSHATQYTLDIDHSQFTDYFLSMKEMKCLEGPELWCHLAYPYESPRTISPDNTQWLSHDLLFMFKKSNEFGANFWNGIYYEFAVTNEGLVGHARAVDLNELAAPPDDLSAPPLSPMMLEDVDEGQRWLPAAVIR